MADDQSSKALVTAIKSEQALLYGKRLGYIPFQVAVAAAPSATGVNSPHFDFFQQICVRSWLEAEAINEFTLLHTHILLQIKAVMT